MKIRDFCYCCGKNLGDCFVSYKQLQNKLKKKNICSTCLEHYYIGAISKCKKSENISCSNLDAKHEGITWVKTDPKKWIESQTKV